MVEGRLRPERYGVEGVNGLPPRLCPFLSPFPRLYLPPRVPGRITILSSPPPWSLYLI